MDTDGPHFAKCRKNNSIAKQKLLMKAKQETSECIWELFIDFVKDMDFSYV